MDFTLSKYKSFLTELKNASYPFQTYIEYLTNPLEDNVMVLRHDVDLKPQNSLSTAKIESDLGIRAVYYFRAVPKSWDGE